MSEPKPGDVIRELVTAFGDNRELVARLTNVHTEPKDYDLCRRALKLADAVDKMQRACEVALDVVKARDERYVSITTGKPISPPSDTQVLLSSALAAVKESVK